jgi:hypothetical protein
LPRAKKPHRLIASVVNFPGREAGKKNAPRVRREALSSTARF